MKIYRALIKDIFLGLPSFTLLPRIPCLPCLCTISANRRHVCLSFIISNSLDSSRFDLTTLQNSCTHKRHGGLHSGRGRLMEATTARHTDGERNRRRVVTGNKRARLS